MRIVTYLIFRQSRNDYLLVLITTFYNFPLMLTSGGLVFSFQNLLRLELNVIKPKDTIYNRRDNELYFQFVKQNISPRS